MARRIISKASNPAGNSTKWKFTPHAVSSGLLIEFDPQHPVWLMMRAGGPPLGPKPQHHDDPVDGCIAKITPPAGTAEGHVITLETALYQRGARAVRRMPSPPDDRVQVAPGTTAPPAGQTMQRSLRQVAIDRAKRA